MEGNKIFPNDNFRDKIRPPRIYCSYIGCEYCTLWGEEGMHDFKGGKYVPLDYIHIVCTLKCCHIKRNTFACCH